MLKPLAMLATTTAVLGAAVLGAACAIAETQALTGEALKSAVVGRTVVLDTPAGGIPISYRDNGTMIGRAKDMSLYTGQERDKGRWWVKSDQICQQWDVWLDARAYCFTLRVDGSVVHWRRNDGRTGTATIVASR